MLLKVIYCNWSSEKNLHWHSFAKYTRVWVITVIVLHVQLITVQIIAKRCPCVFVDKLWSRKKNLKQFEAVCLLEDYVSLNILWLFGVFKRKRRDRMTWISLSWESGKLVISCQGLSSLGIQAMNVLHENSQTYTSLISYLSLHLRAMAEGWPDKQQTTNWI